MAILQFTLYRGMFGMFVNLCLFCVMNDETYSLKCLTKYILSL